MELRDRVWNLEIWYTERFSRELDEEIEKVVGMPCWASGGGLGERDMQFDFFSEEGAKIARDKLLDVFGERLNYGDISLMDFSADV